MRAYTDSTSSPPTLGDGGLLFPRFLQRTAVLTLDPDTRAPSSFGWLDALYSPPARGGSVAAFGRVWISGHCENTDGGFCNGQRNAYLMGIMP